MSTKEYQRQWHIDNKERRLETIKAQKKVRKEANRQKVRDIKESNPCVDCGQFYSYWVMDFDHLDDKERAISKALNEGWGWDKIQTEIDKCELVCSNCHRTRTHNRRIHGSLAETD